MRLIKGKAHIVSVLLVCYIVHLMRRINRLEKLINEKDLRIQKFVSYFYLFDRWITLKEQKNSIEKILKNKDYNSIAIYGLGAMGKHIYEDLKNSDVKVDYAIDVCAGSIYSDLKIFSMDYDLPKVDAVVVTVTYSFNKIKKQLQDKVDCPIINLEDLLFEN